LPHPDDQNASSSTVTKPELNPLLNPILGQNMGRWAEVYFTTPPENREDAVSRLLRELEAENPTSEHASGILAQDLPAHPQNDSSSSPSPDGLSAATRIYLQAKSTHAENETVHCGSCGQDNPESYLYCGNCGTMLEDGAAPPESQVDPFPSSPTLYRRPVETQMEPLVGSESNSVSRSMSGSGSIPEPMRHEGEFWRTQDQDHEEDLPAKTELTFGEARPLSDYRLYIGAAVAFLILVLGYMAWRSAQAAHVPDELSSVPQHGVTPTVPATPTPTPAPPQLNSAESSPPTGNAAEMSASRTVKSGKTETQPPVEQAAGKTPLPSAIEADDPHAASSPATISELAMAQRYLDGSDGKERDSAEAAQWLWKAIAKHNGEALLLLADLYLKGDGVPKNCEQARVLLDTASRKHVRGAGEQLRHLADYGCE
jgi:hypothetical protein